MGTADGAMGLLLDKGLLAEVTCFASRTKHLRTQYGLFISCHRNLKAVLKWQHAKIKQLE